MPSMQLQGMWVTAWEPDKKVQRGVCLDVGGQEDYIFGGDLVLALRSLTKLLAGSTIPSLACAGGLVVCFVLMVLCPQSCLGDAMKWKVRVNSRVRESQTHTRQFSPLQVFSFPGCMGSESRI